MTSQTPRTAKTFIPSDIAEAFVQFSRNGRWGTCCDCPRDTDGKAYPEFCANAERGDHYLTIDQLAAQHKTYIARVENGEIKHHR